MQHKIKCQNSCCPTLEFKCDKVIVRDDFQGAISVDREKFLEWVETHVHGDPERAIAIVGEEDSEGLPQGAVYLKKWQIAALKAVFEEQVVNHPAVCPA